MPSGDLGRQIAAAGLAVQFLTRLPLPVRYSPEALAHAPRYFPLAGGLVGAVAAGVFWALSAPLGGSVAALLAIAAAGLLTGGLHEDGLADLFDGLGGGRSAERALEIMRDSRIGSYGVLALLLVVGLQVALLVRLGPILGAAGLFAGHVVSRASMAVALTAGRYLRADGAGSGMAGPQGSVGIAVMVGLAALGLLALPGAAVLPALAGVVVAHLVLRAWYGARLGGATGDCLGAQQQIGHVGLLLGVAIWQGAA
ncbi:MAG: adenosylcobinamide-GDP ribazoletransferase [Pseudomonadota bacterium]